MGNENQLYSISLGVASLQGGLVGVATALSPATCRPFQVFSPSFFVGLELRILTTVGHQPSMNSGLLINAFYKDLPYQDLHATVFDSEIRPHLVTDSKLYLVYLKGRYET